MENSFIQTGSDRILAVFITFNFVSFCWIFFRAPDMESVKIMLKQIFENFSPGSYMTVIPAYSSVFLLMIVGYIIHFLPEMIKESYRGYFIRIPLLAQMCCFIDGCSSSLPDEDNRVHAVYLFQVLERLFFS